MSDLFYNWSAQGTRVYFRSFQNPAVLGGIDFAGCPEPEKKAALLAAAPELGREVERMRDHLYNPFEPDNQCDEYKRLDELLARAQGRA